MENDLLIPLFWTLAFGILIAIGLRKLSKKVPREKKWVRPEPDSKDDKGSD